VIRVVSPSIPFSLVKNELQKHHLIHQSDMTFCYKISDLHVQSRVKKKLELIIVGNCKMASTTRGRKNRSVTSFRRKNLS